MERQIKIFKSFEELDAYDLEQMCNTSIAERFRQLFFMQQITKAFHPATTEPRKVIIKHGCFKP